MFHPPAFTITADGFEGINGFLLISFIKNKCIYLKHLSPVKQKRIFLVDRQYLSF